MEKRLLLLCAASFLLVRCAPQLPKGGTIGNDQDPPIICKPVYDANPANAGTGVYSGKTGNICTEFGTTTFNPDTTVPFRRVYAPQAISMALTALQENRSGNLAALATTDPNTSAETFLINMIIDSGNSNDICLSREVPEPAGEWYKKVTNLFVPGSSTQIGSVSLMPTQDSIAIAWPDPNMPYTSAVIFDIKTLCSTNCLTLTGTSLDFKTDSVAGCYINAPEMPPIPEIRVPTKETSGFGK